MTPTTSADDILVAASVTVLAKLLHGCASELQWNLDMCKHVSSPSTHNFQDAGISWQDNVNSFTGC